MSTIKAKAITPEERTAEIILPAEKSVQVITTPTAQVVFVEIPGIQGPPGPKGDPGDAAPLETEPTEVYLEARGTFKHGNHS